MKKKCLLLLAWLMVVLFARAQQPVGKEFTTYVGMKGIKKKFSELRQSGEAQKGLRRAQREKLSEEIEEKAEKKHFRLDKTKRFRERLNEQKEKGPALKEEEITQEMAAPVAPLPTQGPAQDIWSNFLASTFNETPFVGWPPDPNGDVGPTQVAVITNGSLKVFGKRDVTDPPVQTTKNSSNVTAPSQFAITTDEFFSPLFRAETFYTSDPHIHYDRLTKRWFVVAIEINATLEDNLVFLAVSDGEEITDETSFTFYSFNSTRFPVNPAIEFQPFLDFPTLGIDRNAVVIGGNDFFADANLNTDSVYFVGYVIDKKRLINGDLLVYTTILGKFDAHSFEISGMIVPQGVHNPDAAGIKSLFAGITNNLDGISLATIDYGLNAVPVRLKRTIVPVEPWNFPRDITALGSPMPIDPNDTRLLGATIQRNKMTGKVSLWTAHAIGVNQNGEFVPDHLFTARARTASRWYEIGDIYISPKLNQQGTLYDPTPSGRRATMYFNPTIVASGQGHAVMGGTVSAYNDYLNAFVAGRYFDDPANTLHTPVKATTTTAIYAPQNSFTNEYIGRWGDFSQTVVDPLDNQTMWTFQEYTNVDDSYGTRAVQLKAPPPPSKLQPIGSLSNKVNNDIVIVGLAENHEGFFDPGSDPGGPGFKRLTVKSTGGINLSYLKVVSPTEIRFRLFTYYKPAGNYQLTITNPDGQSVTLDYTIVDGNTTLKPALTVNKEAAAKHVASSSIYPNPTQHDFRLVVDAISNMTGRIVVTDLNGKQISSSVRRLSKGNNSIGLSLSSVSKGSYLVVVYNADNTVIAAHKIVKN